MFLEKGKNYIPSTYPNGGWYEVTDIIGNTFIGWRKSPFCLAPWTGNIEDERWTEYGDWVEVEDLDAEVARLRLVDQSSNV